MYSLPEFHSMHIKLLINFKSRMHVALIFTLLRIHSLKYNQDQESQEAKPFEGTYALVIAKWYLARL